MRNRHGLKGTWNEALSRLVLPTSPWTAEGLLRAYVEQVRSHKLILSRDPVVASPNGPSGMWFPTPDTDLVWAHPAISGIQYDHVLGHELGHMVNGDEPDRLNLTSVVRLLMGACTNTSGLLDDVLASHGVRCRADGTSNEDRERKAEDFGYFAERWMAKMSPRHVTTLEANLRESLDT